MWSGEWEPPAPVSAPLRLLHSPAVRHSRPPETAWYFTSLYIKDPHWQFTVSSSPTCRSWEEVFKSWEEVCEEFVLLEWYWERLRRSWQLVSCNWAVVELLTLTHHLTMCYFNVFICFYAKKSDGTFDGTYQMTVEASQEHEKPVLLTRSYPTHFLTPFLVIGICGLSENAFTYNAKSSKLIWMDQSMSNQYEWTSP